MAANLVLPSWRMHSVTMWSVLCLFFSVIAFSNSLTATTSYVTQHDLRKILFTLQPGFDSQDLPAIHYSVLGYHILKQPFPKTDDVCKKLIQAANGKPSVEVIYQVTTTWKAYGGKCSGALPVMNLVKVLNEVLGTANIQDTFIAVASLDALGQKPQAVDKIVSNLQAAIKKDDSLANLGYLFNVAALLGSKAAFAFDRIEDAIVQADEVDSINLQFEGGLSLTSLIINGAYKLSAALNKPPPITQDQATKFANYFVSRKTVNTPKGVWSLLEALNTLTTNKFHLPVALTVSSASSVSQKNPFVNIQVSDILGGPLGPLTVVAESVTRAEDSTTILSKKNFIATKAPGVYALNLIEAKPKRGIYKLAVAVTLQKADPRISGPVTSSFNIKVTCSAFVEYLDIGTVDIQQTTQAKLDRVQFPNKLVKKLEMDAQQRLIMKFQIQDQTNNELIAVHQSFVKFYNKKIGTEVIFVVTRDSTLQYKFDLILGAKADDFEHNSGDYSVELIIGDAILSNPFSWLIGDISLSFESESRTKTHLEHFQPKPEIRHLFRESERRPPLLVSNIFSVLVIVPLLLLFILWLRIGINVSNLPFTLSGLGFHLGFAGILLLFAWFWLELNMFQTVRYLIPLGSFTFLAGNRLLRHVAQSRSKEL